jgi:hypothetical protein
MAVIVRHKSSQARYVLVGSGFGMYKSSRQNRFFDFLVQEDEGHAHLIAVCDRAGIIKWFYSGDIVVEEIDGREPADYLS